MSFHGRCLRYDDISACQLLPLPSATLPKAQPPTSGSHRLTGGILERKIFLVTGCTPIRLVQKPFLSFSALETEALTALSNLPALVLCPNTNAEGVEVTV